MAGDSFANDASRPGAPSARSVALHIRLIVVGTGATAEQLTELGSQLGYGEVRLCDAVPAELDSSDHLIIAEENTEFARVMLAGTAKRELLPAYVGYAAPHAEGIKALVGLVAQRIPKHRLDAISAPAGVDIGAETPTEVAIAVAAELVSVLRGRRGAAPSWRAQARRARSRS